MPSKAHTYEIAFIQPFLPCGAYLLLKHRIDDNVDDDDDDGDGNDNDDDDKAQSILTFQH